MPQQRSWGVPERNPYTVRREVDPDSGDHLWIAEVNEATPDIVPQLASEIINNIRTPLDHVAWNFARLHHDPPPDNTAFIVTRNETSWRRNASKLRGVHPDAAQVIRDLQPFVDSRPQVPLEAQPLWLLNRLWNDDKHRGPHIAGANTQNTTFNVGSFHGPSFPHTEFGPFADGAVIARFVPPTGPDAHHSVDFTFALAVAFSDGPAKGAPILACLSGLRQFVGGYVLPRFEALI